MNQKIIVILNKISFIKLLINMKFSGILEKYKNKIKQFLTILSSKSRFNRGNSIIHKGILHVVV